MSADVSAKVRMYRFLELGDCFLITFTADNSQSHMLVDCGSFRNSAASIARLRKITADIKKELDGAPLDVVVATHQHNDHVNGFVHCENEFRDMGVGQVWLAWLDDPQDKMAQEVGKAHNNLRRQLAAVRNQMRASALTNRAERSFQVLDDMLGFYEAEGAAAVPEIPANSIKFLKELGRAGPEYLRPGQTLEMPGLPAGKVRVHVLGPPRVAGNDLLYRKDPRSGESYDRELASALLSATKILDAVNIRKGLVSREEQQYPFVDRLKRHGSNDSRSALAATQRRYNADGWRKIDHDWLEQASRLALYMDTFTNNSSVVLAVELVAARKVLLFAADAQTGNCLSWSQVKWERKDVSTDDLLARTVLYKVGHHGSHNATLVQNFEKMTSPDLMALVPVHKKDPNITKPGGWKMPAKNLFKHLVDATDHRVLQMDCANPASCDPNKNPAKAAWKRVAVKPKVSDLFVELEIA